MNLVLTRGGRRVKKLADVICEWPIEAVPERMSSVVFHVQITASVYVFGASRETNVHLDSLEKLSCICCIHK